MSRSRNRRRTPRAAVPAELTPRAEWEPEPAPDPEPPPAAPDPAPSTALVPSPMRLTRENADALTKRKPCAHCGGWHARACPRIRRMEFHPNDVLAAVEFWPDGKWPAEQVIWPEQVAEALDG